MSKFTSYMQKEASVFGTAAEATFTGGLGLIPYVFAIPMAGGAAFGYLTSKMTSPSDSDVSALQARVMDETVQSELAIRKRQLAAMKQRIADRLTTQKEIGTKRDMFV